MTNPEDILMCKCGNAAVKRVSGAQTKNAGREFWACSKRVEDGGCKHFIWNDEVGKEPPAKRPRTEYVRSVPKPDTTEQASSDSASRMALTLLQEHLDTDNRRYSEIKEQLAVIQDKIDMMLAMIEGPK